MTTMIETIKLSRAFGSIKAVSDLSFKVGQGEVLGFLGPNGAGKSTTMKMLTCFISPSGGTATVCGHDILKDPTAVRRQIGYLPESAPAYSEMSVIGFLRFIGAIRGYGGAELAKRIDGVVAKGSLKGVLHQSFETLSKGFKRRTCLAQALLHDPKVLIMDEPTDGLDPNQKHEVRNLIRNLGKTKAIVFSTHILEEVDAACSRAVVIAGGRLVADGTPEELKQRSRHHGAVKLSIRGASEGPVREALFGIADVESVEAVNGGGAYLIFPKHGRSIAAEVAQVARGKNWDIAELHVEEGRLDEVFRNLTRHAGEVRHK